MTIKGRKRNRRRKRRQDSPPTKEDRARFEEAREEALKQQRIDKQSIEDIDSSEKVVLATDVTKLEDVAFVNSLPFRTTAGELVNYLCKCLPASLHSSILSCEIKQNKDGRSKGQALGKL
jgi:hypothetical protein